MWVKFGTFLSSRSLSNPTYYDVVDNVPDVLAPIGGICFTHQRWNTSTKLRPLVWPLSLVWKCLLKSKLRPDTGTVSWKMQFNGDVSKCLSDVVSHCNYAIWKVGMSTFVYFFVIYILWFTFWWFIMFSLINFLQL